jgi:hypothetical protein
MKEGELLLARRKKDMTEFHHDEFGPCPGCLAWLSLEASLVKHQKQCPAGKDEATYSKGIDYLQLKYNNGQE